MRRIRRDGTKGHPVFLSLSLSAEGGMDSGQGSSVFSSDSPHLGQLTMSYSCPPSSQPPSQPQTPYPSTPSANPQQHPGYAQPPQPMVSLRCHPNDARVGFSCTCEDEVTLNTSVSGTRAHRCAENDSSV